MKDDEEFKWFDKVWEAIHRKSPKMSMYSKSGFKSDKKMPWNIYGAKTLGEGLSRFKFIHYVLKYKIIVPALWIMKRIMKKHWDDKIPDEIHNKNLLIFEKAFDMSTEQWLQLYLSDTNMEAVAREKQLNKTRNADCFKLLEIMKKSVLLIALNDTAYREFLNMLMHSIAQLMIREYKGKKVNHLIYNSDSVYDVNYVLMMKKIQDMTMPKTEEVEKDDNTKTNTNAKQGKKNSKNGKQSKQGKTKASR